MIWAVVVAGGRGTRLGSPVPKQFLELGQCRVVDHAVRAAASVCDGVVLVLPRDMLEERSDAQVVAGGSTRSQSVRAGLSAVPGTASVVVVHDAARPLAGPPLFERVIDAVRRGADAAVPAVTPVDTLKQVDSEGRVVATLDRRRIVAVQTPQAFKPEILRRAHEAEPEVTDDAAAVEAVGGSVVTVPGDARNLKITLPGDLQVAEMLLAGRA